MGLKIGDILVQNGQITEKELNTALRRHYETGEKLIFLLSVVGRIQPDELAQMLSDALHVPLVTRAELERAPAGLMNLIPAAFVQRFQILPYFQADNVLYVAMADPTDQPIIDSVASFTRLTVRPAAASFKIIEQLLGHRLGKGALCAEGPRDPDRKAQGPRPLRRLSGKEEEKKILYVEDNNTNWAVADLELSSKYKLTRAVNSWETFQLIKDTKFDLILMDIELAGSDLNGIEITAVIKGKHRGAVPAYVEIADDRREVPIVYVTAYSARYSKQELLSSGADDVITKPVNFTSLSLVMSRLMLRGISGSAPS